MWNFEDRIDAGRELARSLMHRTHDDAVVLGLPRGGVPVAAEVARGLNAPLDVIVVRKVGAPGHPELAMAAVGEEGAVVRNPDAIMAVGVGEEELAAAERRSRDGVESRLRARRPAGSRSSSMTGSPPVPRCARRAPSSVPGVRAG